MRVRTKVWIGVVVVCIGLTVYEIPNVRLIWRYWRAVVSSKQRLSDKAVLEPVLTEEIVATDPEAADILRYFIAEPNDDDLVDLVIRYPQNELFLAQMAYRIADANLIDARVASLLPTA